MNGVGQKAPDWEPSGILGEHGEAGHDCWIRSHIISKRCGVNQEPQSCVLPLLRCTIALRYSMS